MILTSITSAQRNAREIEQITSDTISFVEAKLKQLYELSTKPAVLDVFGTHAVDALTAYTAFVQALTVVKPNHTVPSFDLNVYQPQADGSVTYIAPGV